MLNIFSHPLVISWLTHSFSFLLIDQQRPGSHAHLADGHLALSGLQVRGHAMFSHKDLPLDSETLEYAWLLEVTIGDLTGRLTAPQVCGIQLLYVDVGVCVY